MSPDLTLSGPLHFCGLYRQRVATGAQAVISDVEYIPITSAVFSMHMLSVMASQALYYTMNVFLFAPWLFIVFCAVLPCPRPCLKWQPSSPSEGRKQRLSIPSRRPLDMPVNKMCLVYFRVLPFSAGTYFHSRFAATSDLLPLQRYIYNQLASMSISYIPCFHFDIQIDVFTRSPANKRNIQADSNLVTKCSISHSFSQPTHTSNSLCEIIVKRIMTLCYGLLV